MRPTSFSLRVGIVFGVWMVATGALAGAHDPAPTPALPPDEAAKSFRVPPGFEVRLFAAEPDVVNPVAMTWDDRGRLWVVELIDYPYTVKEGAKSLDRVKVLEDTDGDGRADKVTVFARGFNLATAVQVGNGGVYVGQAPHLYFLKDTDGDDVADTRDIVLTGFGLEDRHELLNNFAWGPDGWLYMTHGVFTHSKVVDPANPDDSPVKMNAAVARYNPVTKKFERWADGVSNQWGIDWDRYGNAFVSACVVEHLWHIVPGGVYVRQAGVPGWPYAYDLLKHINDHKHYRAAYSGIQVYQGDSYPDEYRGTILMGNIHGNCVNRDQLVPNGSSFVGKDLHKGKDHLDDAFLNSTDGWFRPVSTQVGPDGNLWVMDWYDKYPCYQNARSPDLDRSRGRIWRVVYTGNEKGKKVPARPEGLDLQKLPDGELVKLLGHKNVWMRRHAQRVLTERRAAVGPELLITARNRALPLETRLAALWTLHGVGQLDEKALRALAPDPEPAVRTWVARLAAERANAGDDAANLLLLLAGDASPVVRAAVAAAARRVDSPVIPDVLTTLLDQRGTAEDPTLPHLIWYALEPWAARDPQPFFTYYSGTASALACSGPLVPRSIARRLYASGDEKLAAALLGFLDKHKDNPVAAPMLDGILAGHLDFMSPPAGGKEWVARMAATTNTAVAERARRLATVWGSTEAVQAAIKTLSNSKAPDEHRAAAAKLLRGRKTDAVRRAMLAVLSEGRRETVKLEVLQALAETGDDESARAVLQAWDKLATAELKAAAAQALAGRAAWAKLLLAAVKDKKVQASDIPLPALRMMGDHAAKDAAFKQLMGGTVGFYRSTPADKQKIIEAKKASVMSGPVDKERGHQLFLQHCGVCHQLNGEGANPPVGPDITGVGRGTLDLLLNNVIDPDQVIGAGYENTIVDTEDGDTKTGRLIEETDRHIKLLAAGPKEEVIRKADIRERRVSNKSVMPEGFEQVLKEDEFRDLIRYVLEAPVGKPAAK